MARDDIVARSIVMLNHGPITLVGPAGVGATTAAALVASRLLQRQVVSQVVAVRLDRYTRPGDVTCAIGLQVGALLPGVASSVQEALARIRAVVLLDDADLAPEATEQALELDPSARWITTGRALALGTPIEVDPLTDEEMRVLLRPGTDPAPYRGLPVLVGFPDPPLPEDPWAALGRLPTGAESVLALPFGRRKRPPGLSTAFLRPIHHRAIPRRCVTEQLGLTEPGAGALAAALRDEGANLEQVVLGLTQAGLDELALYRAAAARVRDADTALLAGAAAARIALSQFRIGEALEACRQAQDRPQDTLMIEADRFPPALALLIWVEGDVHLALGEESAAEVRYTRAEAALRAAEQDDLAHLVARANASSWSLRGNVRLARLWLQRARETLPVGRDAAANAELLRLAGDVAGLAGELVGAEALYDEARALLGRGYSDPRVPALLTCGQAALDLARGQFAPAHARLWPDDDVPDHPVVMGALSFRRAELALRRRRLDDARTNAAIAKAAWWTQGQLMGLILVERLLGDITAIAGDREAAAEHYRRAIGLCVPPRALVALSRCLERLLAVEREGLPGPHVEELREQLDQVQLALRVDQQDRGAGKL